MHRLPTRWLRSLWIPAILSIIVAVVVLVAMYVGAAGFDARLRTGLVYLVVVVGLYVFIGNSGVVSFGHIAFMAIGAYGYALMTIPQVQKAFLLSEAPSFIQNLSVPVIPAVIAAGLLAALVAAVAGWPLMRLSGISASIALFAVLMVVSTIISQTTDITRGDQTLLGVPIATSAAEPLVWALVAIFAAFAFQTTRAGLRLRCSREDEFGASAIGISIPVERMKALVVSAFFLGVGGALWAGQQGSLTPDQFYISMTFTTLAMLVVGGMRSLTGAVIGTMAVFAVSEALLRLERGFQLFSTEVSPLPGLQLLGVSALGLLILLFRPGGITGGREVPSPWGVLARLRRGSVSS